MEQRRFNYLICRLKRFELSQCESQFIELAKNHFREKSELTEEQQAILEGLYNEKLRWAKLGLVTEKRVAGGSSRKNQTRFPRKLPLDLLQGRDDS